MLSTVIAVSLLLTPQVDPASRPTTSRPMTSRQADDPRSRLVEAEWSEDAPGHQVLQSGGRPVKFLAIRGGRYSTPDKLETRVREKDLVIGLQIGQEALAYPVNMLGGPDREIINDELAGVPFAVNW